MPLPLSTNPALQGVPVYQPGRPIEEVARELGLPADDIIKLASNETRSAPPAWHRRPCAKPSHR